jgi:hypothetical protein
MQKELPERKNPSGGSFLCKRFHDLILTLKIETHRIELYTIGKVGYKLSDRIYTKPDNRAQRTRGESVPNGVLWDPAGRAGKSTADRL